MAAAKVVRVEDVEGSLSLSTPPPPAILASGDSLPQMLDRKISSKPSHDLQVKDSTNTEMTRLEEEEEQKDKVYPLPDDWPRIKQLERPMSCALSTSRMPCVRKAVSHLELIQNIIDEWFKRAVSVAQSRSSTRSASSESVLEAPKKHLRFRDPTSTRSTSALSTTTKTSCSSPAATLSVNGLGAESPASTAQEDKDELGLDIPYLGAEDVIEEALTLLARLELDRETTLERFKIEKEIAVNLKRKIDDLCLRRLRELPELVQREHEACIVDLNELQWHLAYTSRTQSKTQQRKDNAQLINSRLHEDIEFVKMHVPLVEEKLVLELQAMDRIKKAQVETNQELMTTKQRQAKTEQKSTEALSKAETERGHIRRELDNVRDNLTQISVELSTAKMTFNSYVHQVTDIGHQLTDNAQELEVLAVKDTNAKAAEEMQASKVRNLQSKITDAEFEYRRLENANEQSEQELMIMEKKNSACIEDLQQKAKALESKLRVITRGNSELKIEIEDTNEKIKKCQLQKVADEKNIRRIHRENERVATMMNATMEEHTSMSTLNHHIKDQLHTEQEKAFRTEESLKNKAETLRRQVKEEIHTRTVMQARITSDTAEIEKTRSESGKKKEKADKVASDVDLAVTVVLDKVEKLRATKDRKDKQKLDLKEKMAAIKKQHELSQEEFEKRLSVLKPHYSVLKDEVGNLDKVLDHMSHKTDLMNKKIEEMDSAQSMMDKVSAKTQASLKEQKDELEELNKQQEAIWKIVEDLKVQVKAVNNRLRDGQNRHEHLIQDRSAVLSKQEEDKTKGLTKNKDLAARYRQLQNEFFVKKEELLRTFDERLKLETKINDVKQLRGLQSKMHGALAEYFKLSGLFNEGELTRLEQASSENGHRVGQLQGDMEEALSLITSFLQTEMDGTRARQMAWEAVQKMSATDVVGAGGTPPVMAS